MSIETPTADPVADLLRQREAAEAAAVENAWRDLREILTRDEPKQTDGKRLSNAMALLSLSNDDVLAMRQAVAEAIASAKVAEHLPRWEELEADAARVYAEQTKRAEDEIAAIRHSLVKAATPLTGCRQERQKAEQARRRLEELSGLHPTLIGTFFTPACFIVDPVELAARQQREAIEAMRTNALNGGLVGPAPEIVVEKLAHGFIPVRGDFGITDGPEMECPIFKIGDDEINRRVDQTRRDLAWMLANGEIDAKDCGPAVKALARSRHGWTGRHDRDDNSTPGPRPSISYARAGR